MCTRCNSCTRRDPYLAAQNKCGSPANRSYNVRWRAPRRVRSDPMARFSPFFLVAALAIFSLNSGPSFAQSLPQSLPADANGITDPAEYQAYIEALKSDNPFVIDKFVTQYPQSSGLEKVLQHGIARYVESD